MAFWEVCSFSVACRIYTIATDASSILRRRCGLFIIVKTTLCLTLSKQCLRTNVRNASIQMDWRYSSIAYYWVYESRCFGNSRLSLEYVSAHRCSEREKRFFFFLAHSFQLELLQPAWCEIGKKKLFLPLKWEYRTFG